MQTEPQESTPSSHLRLISIREFRIIKENSSTPFTLYCSAYRNHWGETDYHLELVRAMPNTQIPKLVSEFFTDADTLDDTVTQVLSSHFRGKSRLEATGPSQEGSSNYVHPIWSSTVQAFLH